MTDEEKRKKQMKNVLQGQGDLSAPTIREINPLGMRVVVKIVSADDVTDGGLYLPKGAKDKMAESLLAEVLSVASALDEETQEETNVSGIPLGATVLIPKEVGVKVPWDDSLRIVDTQDILALVEEQSVS